MVASGLTENGSALQWLRRVLLAACGITLCLSAPLWLNVRAYPVLPVAGTFPVLLRPWDILLFVAVLLFLGIAFWKYRLGVAGFLFTSLWLALQDQNRWQPWFYLYWVMLLL